MGKDFSRRAREIDPQEKTGQTAPTDVDAGYCRRGGAFYAESHRF